MLEQRLQTTQQVPASRAVSEPLPTGQRSRFWDLVFATLHSDPGVAGIGAAEIHHTAHRGLGEGRVW